MTIHASIAKLSSVSDSKRIITMLFYIILISSAAFANTKHLPADIEICHKSDPEFAECFTRSTLDALRKFAQGNPELGVNRLEPMFIEALDLNDANTETVSLQQHYENMNIHGITKATITNMSVSIEEDNCFWSLTVTFPHLLMESDYRIKGKILVLPINGHGKCRNTFKNIIGYYKTNCELYKKKNAKTYLRLTDYEFDMLPEAVHFDFENIVDGNEQLSKEITKTVNENALTVFKDVKSGFEKAFAEIYKQSFNNVLSKIPADELFPQ